MNNTNGLGRYPTEPSYTDIIEAYANMGTQIAAALAPAGEAVADSFSALGPYFSTSARRTTKAERRRWKRRWMLEGKRNMNGLVVSLAQFCRDPKPCAYVECPPWADSESLVSMGDLDMVESWHDNIQMIKQDNGKWTVVTDTDTHVDVEDIMLTVNGDTFTAGDMPNGTWDHDGFTPDSESLVISHPTDDMPPLWNPYNQSHMNSLSTSLIRGDNNDSPCRYRHGLKYIYAATVGRFNVP